MATIGSGVATVLTTSPVALVTSGANELLTMVRVQVQNIDTVSRLITLYQVPSGGTASDTTNKVHTQTVYAGQSTSLDVAGFMAAAGATLQIKADANSAVIMSVNQFRSDQQA